MQPKTIGILDYRLDNFHADVYSRALRGALASRAYVIAGATAMFREPSVAWCAAQGIRFYDTIDELQRAAQFFLVLAPSNPEVHLPLCEQVFPFGRPTFVDKPIAQDLQTAQKIFDLADRYGVPLQTSSALRTTAVQQEVRGLRDPLVDMTVSAGGSSWEEYGIHPVELVVSCLGPDVRELMRVGNDDMPILILRFARDRTAVIHFHAKLHVPFRAELRTATEVRQATVDDQRLFLDAASAILDFFDHGQPLIDRQESLMIRRVLDLAMSPDANRRFCRVAPVAPALEGQPV